ncbi:MAG: DNA-directed RNA polymerase subunit K [archaeon]
MNKITRFEKARLISARALQISLGAPALVKAPLGTSIFEIAKLELEKKILPLTVMRTMPSGEVTIVEVE